MNDNTNSKRKVEVIKPPLAKLRRERNLSQQAVSMLTGLPVTLISKHENKHSGISLSTAVKYAAAFEMPLQDLLDASETDDAATGG